MRADRFDDLTAALGGATSRRKALKVLGVGIVALLVGRSAPRPRSSGTLRTSPIVTTHSDPRNVVAGSCADFVARLGQGVYDVTGTQHSGAAGYTHARPAAGSTGWTVKRRRQGWQCPCDRSKTFGNQSECDAFCGRGLSGCIVKCGGGGVCLTSNPVDISYVAEPTVSKLEWLPGGAGEKALSANCKKEMSRVSRQIDAHEQHHADDIADVIDYYNSYPGQEFEGCGDDEAAAAADLERKISDYMASQVALIEGEIDTVIAEFHGTPAGAKLTVQCGQCP